jgi:transketolase
VERIKAMDVNSEGKKPPFPKSLSIDRLKEIARQVRRDIILMMGRAGSGHPGGSLSATDILVALFFNVMRHDPQDPDWRERDRFILSKGHAAPALYAVLAQTGYIERNLLKTLRKLGSPLQGHPDKRKLPILEASTGSLGQGLSIGVGEALGLKLQGIDARVYVMIGDGESDEGQIWEASCSASHFKIRNLTAILDYNKFQLDGPVREIMDLEPLKEKWESFGWRVWEIDGHDYGDILRALGEASVYREGPGVIIAHTVKGKGVSFMENNNEFHGKAPKPEQVKEALKELGFSPDEEL